MRISKTITAIIDDISIAQENHEAYMEYQTFFKGNHGEPMNVLSFTSHPVLLGVQGRLATLRKTLKRLFRSHITGVTLVIVTGYIIGRALE